MSSRDAFLENVRLALGREKGAGPTPLPEATGLSRDATSMDERARAVLRDMDERASELMAELAESAGEAGWTAVRVVTPREAAEYVAGLARDFEARSIVRSAHSVVDRMQLGRVLAGTGTELTLVAAEDGADDAERDGQRRALREKLIQADVGVTGADYAIAETGSCVLNARRGVSRLVSLLPPVHVAVVERGQVLPSLDELFVLQRRDLLHGKAGSYMNIISGPSRSADIEQTLVRGVHGPHEVHMVLLG